MSISLTKQAALAVKRCLERVPGSLMYSPGKMTTNKEGSPMRSKYLHRLAATLMTASLGAGWVSAGNLDQLNYVSVPGARVADLRTAPNNATFPANPWDQAPFIELINPALTIPPPTFIRTTGGNPQDSATYIRGFIEPPQTGQYTFWVNGSADAEFWLSPTPSSSGAVREAYTDGSTGVGQWAQRLTQRSRAITLTKGQQYYFELIQKSSGVGGAAEIGWWRPDFTLERPLPIRYAQRFVFDATCINGFCSGSFVNERALTTPQFARNPGNNSGSGNNQVFLTENQAYDLSPWVNANYPVAFQWQQLPNYTPANQDLSNPQNLAGEITSTKYIEKVTIAQHNAKAFRITATRSGTTVNSAVTYLSVFGDFNAPTIVSASASGNTNGFNIVFSENVEPASATNKANYAVNNGVVIDRVEMRYGETPNNTVVVYTTGGVPGNSTVTVNNVRDLASNPNTIAANSTADILLSDGIISYFAYGAINGGDAIGGTEIANLYAATNRFTSPSMTETAVVVGGFTVTPSTANRRPFPGLPDLRTTRTEMGIPVNVADNYGAMLVGFVIPPVTGNYNIVIAGDDQSIVYISPDDVPANKVAVATDPQWGGFRAYTATDRRSMSTTGNSAFVRANFTGTAAAADGSTIILNQSKNIRGGTPLVRGNKYYIEALMKEGGGGDNVDVTWQLPGTWTTANNNGLANGQAPIPGVYLQQFAAAGQSGPIKIIEQPAGRETLENRPTTLSVVHGGSPSFIYQWYKDGIIIPDANDREYTLPLPKLADAGNYTVVVRNLFSQDTSVNAAVTVTPDAVAPGLVRAVGSASGSTVTIWFNEVVDPVTAVNPANYSIVQTGTANALSIFGTGTLTGPAPGGFTRVVFQTAPQTQGQNYTITVNNVRDIAATPNTIAANSTVAFTGWVVSKGFALYEIWFNIIGGNVNTVKADPRYPGNPDRASYRTLWESDQNIAEQFGARISGFFFAAAGAGRYDFAMASDDNGELWISSDSNPANIQRIAVEPAWGDRRSWTGTSGGRRAEGENNTFGDNQPILTMAAGERRYMELLYKEGGGGDYGDATMKTPTGGIPANGSASTLRGAFIGAIANPDETEFTFSSHPQSASTGENTTVQFTVGGSGRTLLDKLNNPPTSSAIFWQWQRQAPGSTDWTDIAGANGTTYTTPVLPLADNGVKYRALASIPGLTSPSDVATVSVVVDDVRPVITGVSANPSADSTFGVQNQVRVFFSEPMNTASIENIANYVITKGGNPVTISAAVAASNGRSVTLTVPTMNPGDTFTFTATGLIDRAVAQNAIDPNPTVRNFSAFVLANTIRRQLYFDIGGGSLNNLTNHARFPNSPNVDEFTTLFEMPPTNPNRENFGTRITGLIVPTETAQYHFAISGDDNQGFWLSPDANPANRRLIVAEPQWNGYRSWNTNDRRVGNNGFFPDVTTLPINRSPNTVGATTLQAGVAYYAELLAKEGGGGDSTAVTWWKVGEEMPADGTPAISASFVQSYVNPDNTINISAQPQNQTVGPGTNAVFSVTANPTAPFLGGPISYQWRRGGVNIAGANGSSYSITAADGDNGATFDVVMNAPGAPSRTSTAATLTVGSTVVPAPTLSITKTGNNVVVTYPTTAQAGGHALQKSTGLPGGFAADATGTDQAGTFTTTVDVTAGGAASQSYWRTRRP
jgi:hypothetical protein